MNNNLQPSTEAITPLQLIAAAQGAKTVAEVAAHAKAATSDNLISVTRDTRVEPIALIDSTIINESYVSDILALGTKMFASYYLRAVEMTTKINGVEVAQKLARYNPNRSVINAVVSTASLEDNNVYPSLNASYKVSVEESEQKSKNGVKNDIAGTLKQMDNLALGMTINVTISENEQAHTMPVNIRTIPVSSSPKLIVNTFEIGSNKNSAKERWHRWKAGELSLIGDLILCNDLIDSHRKAEIKDKSGYYKETMRRRRNGTIAGLVSGTPSVANSSNMMIISKRTALQMEDLLEGELEEFKVRERAFEQTSVMLMFVVDPDWERVTIYSRSIEIPTNIQLRDLKSLNNKGGADVEDILRMYQEAAKPNAKTGVQF